MRETASTSRKWLLVVFRCPVSNFALGILLRSAIPREFFTPLTGPLPQYHSGFGWLWTLWSVGSEYYVWRDRNDFAIGARSEVRLHPNWQSD